MVLAFPEPHRRLLRKTNGVERINRGGHRRTRVASLFPNEASYLRLVSVVPVQVSGDWPSGKVHLTFTRP